MPSFVRPLFYQTAEQIYRCRAFDEFTWLDHGFTTRQSAAWIEAHPLTTLRQIHSDSVWDARGLDDRACEGDALISDEPGKRIGVRTADCVPILLVDTVHFAVASVHAGWRGTVSGIVMQTLAAMNRAFGTEPSFLRAAIGPSIRECCYEVGSEVVVQFHRLFPEWPIETTLHKKHISLVDANRRLLADAGVPAAQIFDSGLCTSCDVDTFFSYRREPQETRRLVAYIQRLR